METKHTWFLLASTRPILALALAQSPVASSLITVS